MFTFCSITRKCFCFILTYWDNWDLVTVSSRNCVDRTRIQLRDEIDQEVDEFNYLASKIICVDRKRYIYLSNLYRSCWTVFYGKTVESLFSDVLRPPSNNPPWARSSCAGIHRVIHMSNDFKHEWIPPTNTI